MPVPAPRTRHGHALKEHARAWTRGQDLLNLAPKKPNWDLKRDLSRQLARTEKKTKRAIAELIRTSPAPARTRPNSLLTAERRARSHTGERVLKEKDQLSAAMAAQPELTAGDESD